MLYEVITSVVVVFGTIGTKNFTGNIEVVKFLGDVAPIGIDMPQSGSLRFAFGIEKEYLSSHGIDSWWNGKRRGNIAEIRIGIGK